MKGLISVLNGEKPVLSGTKRGALAGSIAELHEQIDRAYKTLSEIEDFVFTPRPCETDICGQERPQALTVDQKLSELIQRIIALNGRLSDLNDAVQSQLDSELKLV
jgi:hypothetical protein